MGRLSSEVSVSFPTYAEEHCYFPFWKKLFVHIAPGVVSFFTIAQSTTLIYGVLDNFI